MIVTLAGHVDHGKSALVHTLTGAPTDRLREEQRRGLTLDLGFAYVDLGNQRVGFVDVPGHHKFIHNMVAGVASQQFGLLVIAADDGVMPQTLEHLEILRILGLKRGCIAITKCDLVDSTRLATIAHEIDSLVSGSFLAAAPRFVCNTLDPGTLTQLREHLRVQAMQTIEQPDVPFRLAIDRSFSLPGAGCVVTGTVHGGVVHKSESLSLVRSGNTNPAPLLTVRARELRVQGVAAGSAQTGDRVAINLGGVEHQPVHRGDWVVAPGAANRSRALVIEFSALTGARSRPKVKHWGTVHVHLATSHSLGQLALLATDDQGNGLVELVLEEPLQAKHGDIVVVRDYAAATTIGGGRVLYAGQPASRRRSAARLQSLRCYQHDNARECLQALLELGPATLPDWRASYLLSRAQGESIPAGLGAEPLSIDADLWVRSLDYENARAEVLDAIRATGITPAQLQERSNLPGTLVRAATQDLVAQHKIVNLGGQLLPADHGRELSETLQALLARCKPLLNAPQPASLGDLSKTLNLPLAQLDGALQQIAKARALTRISAKRYALPSQVHSWAELTAELAQANPFSVKEFRDRSGLGRNLSIDVLEYFDRKGYTRRTADTRTVVGALATLG